MDYELARQLKDAGFTGNPESMGGWTCSKVQEQGHAHEYKKCDMVHTPTLSELIEACGNTFWSLSKDGGTYEWLAYDEDQSHLTGGKTPEEAVAMLWLELKKS